MDEYIFRAWHYPSKAMIYGAWRQEEALYMFDVTFKHTQRFLLLSHILVNKEFKPMLYCGEHDVKGRMIYEGDLVRRWMGEQEVTVTAVQHTATFWKQNAPISKMQVVGNVFEGIKAPGPDAAASPPSSP